MTVIKYIERIKVMDDLIRRKATGTSNQFAEKLHISRSTLMKYINILKDMGAPVAYDKFRNSYYYLYPCKLIFGFESKMLNEGDLVDINKNNLKKICKILRFREYRTLIH